MQKKQLINWISNIIKTKMITNDLQVLYELEAQIGKFKGNNYQTNQQLSQIKGMEQLDKTNLKFNLNQKLTFNNIIMPNHIQNKKNNKRSYKELISLTISNKELHFNQLTNNLMQFQQRNKKTLLNILILFKIRQIIEFHQIKKKHYQLVLKIQLHKCHLENNIPTLLDQRKLFLQEKIIQNLHYPMCNHQINQILILLDLISNSKLYDIQDKMIQLFKNQILNECEFEIEEAQNKNLNDEQINNLSKLLLLKTKYCLAYLNQQQMND